MNMSLLAELCPQSYPYSRSYVINVSPAYYVVHQGLSDHAFSRVQFAPLRNSNKVQLIASVTEVWKSEHKTMRHRYCTWRVGSSAFHWRAVLLLRLDGGNIRVQSWRCLLVVTFVLLSFVQKLSMGSRLLRRVWKWCLDVDAFSPSM